MSQAPVLLPFCSGQEGVATITIRKVPTEVWLVVGGNTVGRRVVWKPGAICPGASRWSIALFTQKLNLYLMPLFSSHKEASCTDRNQGTVHTYKYTVIIPLGATQSGDFLFLLPCALSLPRAPPRSHLRAEMCE